jgi:tetratricopeptide (TPR) repeat protein
VTSRVLAVCVAAACGGAQHPAEPKPDVRAEVRDAEAAERMRRHDVARVRYEQAVAHATDAESIAFARGRFGETLATWGEYREAIVQLEAAVAARPNEASAWYNLGIVRDHEANPHGAQQALERAEQLAPTDWRPRIALSALHWRLAIECYCAKPAGDLSCARDADAATAEYRGLLELDIPDRLRAKVRWALDQLAKPDAGKDPHAACSREAPASTPTP